MSAVAPNTGYYVDVVADSISPHETRLTTLEICFPRFILAEFNTHRKLSRNSASSRAIPVKTQLARIKDYPFIPEAFPLNESGMSSTNYLYPGDKQYETVLSDWLFGRDMAIRTAKRLMKHGVHKQTANRVLEPYMYHTVVVTATDYANFYSLRISPHAQPEINKIAVMMRDAMQKSVPALLKPGEWHLPYVDPTEEIDTDPFTLAKISSGRAAAVTLLNQQKKKSFKDVGRTDRMIDNGHMSPLEHAAKHVTVKEFTENQLFDFGNFNFPWLQLRKLIPNEAVYIGE